MNYNQTLNFIHSLNKFGIKPGLERIRALMSELSNPQDTLEFVHVAGTNGKGSTSTMLSNIFIADGKKTGLFISPYVVDFRERIQISGKFISESELCELTDIVKAASEKVLKRLNDSVTEFEFITAVALLYFKRQKCDIVVLETGLGGRLDSTNIIKKPLAAVITKIAMDHMAVLGNTIKQIALEKCGIIKENSLVVSTQSQPAEALDIITSTAKAKKCKFYAVRPERAKNLKLLPFSTEFDCEFGHLFSLLPGKHQIENMLLAAQTAHCLNIKKEAISSGIKDTVFPARLEVISKDPLVIIDGAHNKNGAEALADYLTHNKINPVVIIGMMKDKDCEAAAKQILPLCSKVFTVEVSSNSRSITSKELARIAKKYTADEVDVFAAKNYSEAIAGAAKSAKDLNVPLLVCGSLYLASDLRPLLLEYFK